MRAALALVVVLIAGCGARQRAPEGAGDLELRELGDGVWMHTTTMVLPEVGPYPANGLIIVGRTRSILIDTGWQPDQTRRLLAWAQRRGAPIGDVVITHDHDDRRGGLPALPRSMRVHTAAGTLSIDGRRIAVIFPGPGHTRDNLVVWLPDERVLFGGCLVRSATASNLGNLSDADLAAWGPTLHELERYPARLVVPGHGEPGGPELVEHSLALWRAATSPATANTR